MASICYGKSAEEYRAGLGIWIGGKSAIGYDLLLKNESVNCSRCLAYSKCKEMSCGIVGRKAAGN